VECGSLPRGDLARRLEASASVARRAHGWSGSTGLKGQGKGGCGLLSPFLLFLIFDLIFFYFII
jgi:hypothetical protein